MPLPLLPALDCTHAIELKTFKVPQISNLETLREFTDLSATSTVHVTKKFGKIYPFEKIYLTRRKSGKLGKIFPAFFCFNNICIVHLFSFVQLFLTITKI
jgi:hypothetical protein